MLQYLGRTLNLPLMIPRIIVVGDDDWDVGSLGCGKQLCKIGLDTLLGDASATQRFFVLLATSTYRDRCKPDSMSSRQLRKCGTARFGKSCIAIWYCACRDTRSCVQRVKPARSLPPSVAPSSRGPPPRRLCWPRILLTRQRGFRSL